MEAGSNHFLSINKKEEIISQLQKDILFLQGFKSSKGNNVPGVELGPIKKAFPNECFPVAAIHEFLSSGPEYKAATSGFIACLIASLMQNAGVSVWVSPTQTLFPPALKTFGIKPDNIVFIYLQKEKDILWVMEEVLKCPGVAAVVGEVPELDFTASRRLQLAVEQSRVTGFIIRNTAINLIANACVSRWKISPLPSEPEDSMPGVGFPRWNVELLKMRNGKPGIWQMEWSAGRLRPVSSLVKSIPQEKKKKAG